MGGAGGQTVFGAITTGTHGSDFDMPPISDFVVAIHLVADGGKHYWIERSQSIFPVSRIRNLNHITDDNKLKSLYGSRLYGGSNNFEIIRNDNIFNAVVVGAGRFGIVYSIVMRACRQFSLFHRRKKFDDWETIKQRVINPSDSFFNEMHDGEKNRFLQISLSVTPYGNGKHLCGVTKRWNTKGTDDGRKERVGAITDPNNTRLKGPLFEHAGNSFGYSAEGKPPSFLDSACEKNNDIIKGALEQVIDIITSLNNVVSVFDIVHDIAGGDNSLISSVIAALALQGRNELINHLREIIDDDEITLGELLDDIRVFIFEEGHFPNTVSKFLWQLIVYQLFLPNVKDHTGKSGISYAILDGHNYLDKGCRKPADSIEVFFDATNPKLIQYIDDLLAYEEELENGGEAFVGYISLRFTGKTKALIGMQRYERTCAIEISGVKDVIGTIKFIDKAIELAKKEEYKGILHWGQRNEHTSQEIQNLFGQDLTNWKSALRRFTNNGRSKRFSTAFTRRLELEPSVIGQ